MSDFQRGYREPKDTIRKVLGKASLSYVELITYGSEGHRSHDQIASAYLHLRCWPLDAILLESPSDGHNFDRALSLSTTTFIQFFFSLVKRISTRTHHLSRKDKRRCLPTLVLVWEDNNLRHKWRIRNVAGTFLEKMKKKMRSRRAKWTTFLQQLVRTTYLTGYLVFGPRFRKLLAANI